MQIFLDQKQSAEKEVSVSLDWEEFSKYFYQAEESLIKNVEIKGFRKGKAPKDKALEALGEQKIMSEAANLALKDLYPKVIKEKNLEPLGMPQIEIVKLAKGNNFEFKLKVAVLPEVNLPNYKEIAKGVSKKEIKVSQEELDSLYKQLESSKDKFSKEQLEQLNFNKPQEMKALLKKDLKRQKEMNEKQRVRNEILQKIVEKIELDVPEVLLQAELQRALSDLKNNVQQSLKMTYEDYLKKSQKTEEELKKELRENIRQKIKRILVLKEIQKKENVDITEQELEKQVSLFKANMGEKKTEINEKSLKDYFRERLEQEKTLEFLESLLSPIIKP
jgi:FKBP-type peptidyl-prolyl cis-trans isomerase (trigger factor)